MNNVNVSGNCVADPELRHTASGLAVLNLRIAVNNRRKKGDEWVDEPVFINVVAFGAKAEWVNNTATKGEKVFVSGRLTMSEWEKDGNKQSRIDIMADDIEIPKNKDAAPKATKTEAAPAKTKDFDEDVPF